MTLLSSKNIYIKTFIISMIASIVFFVLTAFLFLLKVGDIPLGILLGGVLGSLFYLLLNFLERNKMVFTIIFLVFRFLIFAGLLVLISLMYFKWNNKIFNPISFAFGYLINTIVYTFLSMKNTK